MPKTPLKKVQKLVRDKIPKIIQNQNQTPIWRKMDEDEYKKELIKKLFEEIREFEADQNMEELADIWEIWQNIVRVFGFELMEIEKIRLSKLDKNGGFQNKIFLEEILD
jgi:predicted house-cleaning noncanonical NTP pyrophosphatase (MazG superfamily)